MVLVVSLDVGRKARGLYHVEDARRFASYWYLVMITKLTFRFFWRTPKSTGLQTSQSMTPLGKLWSMRMPRARQRQCPQRGTLHRLARGPVKSQLISIFFSWSQEPGNMCFLHEISGKKVMVNRSKDELGMQRRCAVQTSIVRFVPLQERVWQILKFSCSDWVKRLCQTWLKLRLPGHGRWLPGQTHLFLGKTGLESFTERDWAVWAVLNIVNRHVFKWDNQNLVLFFQSEAGCSACFAASGNGFFKRRSEKGAFVGDHYHYQSYQ